MDQLKNISRSVLLLSLIMHGFILHWGWSSYLDYRRADEIIEVTGLANELLRASAIKAEERGTTSLLLAEKSVKIPVLHEQIVHLRNSGDAIWNNALARKYLSEQGRDNAVLATSLQRSTNAYEEFIQTRALVDRSVAEKRSLITPATWIDVSTRYIDSLYVLHASLLNAIEIPREIERLNQALTYRLWQASEYAGRERGILAYYINARLPVPATIQKDLNNFRYLVEKGLNQVLLERNKPWLDPQVHKAITNMENAFMNGFSGVRELVYSAVSSAGYPMSGDQWIIRATTAIDSIIEVNNAISDVSYRYAHALKQQSLVLLIVIALLLIFSLALTATIMARIRETTTGLYQQKELAELTLCSIGEAVISTNQIGLIECLNPAAEMMLGMESENLRGKPLRNYLSLSIGPKGEMIPNPVDVCLQQKRTIMLETDSILKTHDNREYRVNGSSAPIHDQQGNIVGAVLMMHNAGRRV